MAFTASEADVRIVRALEWEAPITSVPLISQMRAVGPWEVNWLVQSHGCPGMESEFPDVPRALAPT